MSRMAILGPVIVMFMTVFGFSYEDHLYLNAPKVELSQVYEDVELKSMIVPHHLVATDKLEAMYKTAASDEVKNVLIISPDHFMDEDRDMTTSNKNWFVDEGKVYFNSDLYETINFDGLLVSPEVIALEHGLFTHIPYVKRYFPNASVVPVAISKQTEFSYLSDLIQAIPDDTFVIASVDFSHYLSLDQADKNDLVTERILLQGNYEGLFEMSDAYFDSPACLYVVMCYARKQGYKIKVYDHSNSAYYMGLDIPETTSYFFIGFK